MIGLTTNETIAVGGTASLGLLPFRKLVNKTDVLESMKLHIDRLVTEVLVGVLSECNIPSLG